MKDFEWHLLLQPPRDSRSFLDSRSLFLLLIRGLSRLQCPSHYLIYTQYLMLGLTRSRFLINAGVFIVIILTVMLAVCP